MCVYGAQEGRVGHGRINIVDLDDVFGVCELILCTWKRYATRKIWLTQTCMHWTIQNGWMDDLPVSLLH